MIALLLVLAVIVACWNLVRIRQAAEALQEEMAISFDAMLVGLNAGDMVAVETAAMRFWRLAEINRQLTPMQSYARSLHELATNLSEIAAGWRSWPLSAEQRQAVRLQLLKLREMINSRDLSKVDAALVWLQMP